MPELSTFQLKPPRFREALPLVRMTAPGIAPERWLAHCDAVARLGGGLIAAAAPDGALYGIASWRPDDDLLSGTVLRVETMVALEVSISNPVRTSLHEALERQCSELGAVLSLPFRRDDVSSNYPTNGKQAGSRKQALFIFDSVSADCTGPQASTLMRPASRQDGAAGLPRADLSDVRKKPRPEVEGRG